MVIQSDLEEKLKLLSEKEYFYSSLTREDFYRCIDVSPYKAEAGWPIEQISAPSVPLFVNELNLQRILEVEQNSDPYHGRLNGRREGFFVPPFYLYYEEELFIQFVQNNDIRSLCQKYRVVILVGMEEFENYFCQLDVIIPTIICGDEENQLEEKLAQIQQEKHKILIELAQEIYLYYKESGGVIKKRILDGNAKICIMQNDYEPARFRMLYSMFKESVEKFGYQVEICHERGSIFRTDDILKLYQYQPDIVFQINKSRDGRTYQGEVIHYLDKINNLIFINWVQDFHPQILDTEYAKSLRENDYIFSLFDERIMEEYGYPKQNLIYRGIMPASEKDFCLRSVTEYSVYILFCHIAILKFLLQPSDIIILHFYTDCIFLCL